MKRKKNTGEPGNPGQFGSKSNSEADVHLREDIPKPTRQAALNRLARQVGLAPLHNRDWSGDEAESIFAGTQRIIDDQQGQDGSASEWLTDRLNDYRAAEAGGDAPYAS